MPAFLIGFCRPCQKPAHCVDDNVGIGCADSGGLHYAVVRDGWHDVGMQQPHCVTKLVSQKPVVRSMVRKHDLSIISGSHFISEIWPGSTTPKNTYIIIKEENLRTGAFFSICLLHFIQLLGILAGYFGH